MPRPHRFGIGHPLGAGPTRALLFRLGFAPSPFSGPAPLTSLRRKLLSPYVLLLLPVLFWAGNAVVGRAAVGEVPPFALSFWRWAVALAVLAPLGAGAVWAQRAAVRRHFGTLLVLAVTSVSAYNTLLYLALQTTTAINVTLVASALPIVMILLARLWLGEPIGGRRAVGVLISLVGVLAVVGRGEASVLLGLELQAGDFWMLLAVLSWAVYSVLLRRRPTGLTPMALLTVLVALGLPFILPLYLWELAAGATMAASLETAAVIGYVALFPSVLAYLAWNQGVAAVGPSVAGQYTYMVPVVTALLAVAFLGERFQWYHAAGMALIFLGVWLASAPARPR